MSRIKCEGMYDCYYRVGDCCMFHTFDPCPEPMTCAEVLEKEAEQNGEEEE